MNIPSKIALVTDELGWHSTQLIQSLDKHLCTALQLPLSICSFNDCTSGLHLPGFESDLPDGVFVRGIPTGSFETVTFYLLSLIHI